MAGSAVDPIVRHVQRLVCEQAVRDLPDAELLRRFLARQEQEAFAALVRRHGRLVWGVCRHVLRGEHDAEDAFQAVFLVLARQAASIRKGESVGGWLYGVAYRVSRRARLMATRRQRRERRAAVPDEAPEKDLAWRELQSLLDEELHRLPEKYRVPFVLCCLEGQGREEAARELGWKEGTVSSRIARARRMLEDRLARRGVALTAALTAKALWDQTAAASPPAEAVRQAAAACAPGAASSVSAAAALLAQAAVRTGAGRTLAGVLVAALGLTAAALPFSRPPAAAPAPAEEAPAQRPAVDLNGDPLPPGAVARLGTTRFRHGDIIRSLGFTPDGKRLVSHGSDGVRVWDASTGREVSQLLATGGRWINAGILSRDGTTVATAEPGVVRLRSLPDFKVKREFLFDQVRHLRLSPDGKLLSGVVQKHSKSWLVEIWEVESGKRRHSWEAHQDSVWCHDFTPDGKAVVTAGGDKRIRFWDVTTAAKVREVKVIGHPNVVGQLALSPDGATLATVGMTAKSAGGGLVYFPWDNLIRVWDVASGRETRRLEAPAEGDAKGVSTLAFAPDGKALVSGGSDGLLRFWDVAAGKETRRVVIGAPGVLSLAFSPDGKALAVGGGAIRVLDAATGKDAVRLAGGGAVVYGAAVSPDGKTVATTGNGPVTLWDAATGRERGRLGNDVSSIRFLRDGRTLLVAGREPRLRRWDVTTRQEKPPTPLPAKARDPLVALSPDGKVALLRGEKPGLLVMIDLATGQEVDRLKEGDEHCNGAAFAPDGRTLVVWQPDHTAHVWDLKTHKKLRRFEFPDSPTNPPRPAAPGGGRTGWAYGAHLSPDGRLLAYGSQDGYLALHDVRTGECVRVIDKLTSGSCQLAFTPDGRTLAWAGWSDPVIHLLEVATGKERRRLDGHKGRVYSLQFSADGNTLVSGSQDGTGLVWDVLGRSEPLAALDLDACWADLAGDAGRSFGAMGRLLRSPAEAVPFLGKRVRPVPRPDEGRVAAWIADLDSDSFDRRKAATAELERLGESAAEACRKALEGGPSPEARRRLQKLVAALDAEARDLSPERLRVMRGLEVLERAGSPAAREKLKDLAAGAPGAWLTREAKAACDRLAGR